MRKLLLGGVAAIVAGAMFFSPLAYAGPSIPPSTCAVSDIDLTIGTTTYNPTSCVADVEIGQAPADPATETTLLNTAFNHVATPFAFLAKADGGGNSVGAPLDGIQFTLSASTFTQNSGTYTIGWTDVNGTAPDNLPIKIDFDVLINGGSNGDGYQFTGVTLPVTPNTGTGNFQITFFNNGGQNPALSHMIITGGDDVQINPTLVDTPEPASLALLGVGMLGMMAARRRRA